MGVSALWRPTTFIAKVWTGGSPRKVTKFKVRGSFESEIQSPEARVLHKGSLSCCANQNVKMFERNCPLQPLPKALHGRYASKLLLKSKLLQRITIWASVPRWPEHSMRCTRASPASTEDFPSPPTYLPKLAQTCLYTLCLGSTRRYPRLNKLTRVRPKRKLL